MSSWAWCWWVSWCGLVWWSLRLTLWMVLAFFRMIIRYHSQTMEVVHFRNPPIAVIGGCWATSTVWMSSLLPLHAWHRGRGCTFGTISVVSDRYGRSTMIRRSTYFGGPPLVLGIVKGQLATLRSNTPPWAEMDRCVQLPEGTLRRSPTIVIVWPEGSSHCESET